MTTALFNNDQQTLVLNQAITMLGPYPARDETSSYNDDFPIGMIRTFAFTFAPGGSLPAQGQQEAIQQNAALFSVLGTTYGGDGRTTFDLPDLAGTVEVGAGSADPLGTAYGQDQTTITQSQLPPVLGGTSQPVSDAQPSLSVTYMIRAVGDTASNPTNGFTGEVDAFAGNFPPEGFLVANGQTVSVSDYPALFAVIGYTYGGSGSSFALPNLVGRDIVGSSSGVSAGTMVGQQTVTLSNANAPVADGGQGAAFNNQAPGLVLNYLIATSGNYPSSDTSGAPDAPYLGEIRAYAGSLSAIPKGWAWANGQVLSIAQNKPLYSLLGTLYGGDGTTTFALPNLSNSVVAGSGGSDTVGKTFGQNSVSLTAADIQCFCAGTSIATPDGQRAVETLLPGDAVLALQGGIETTARIVWVGQRRVEIGRHPDPSRVRPVRFAPGAIDGRRPERALHLSPDHGLLLDGVLVAARLLVNNVSITVPEVADAHYVHVELEHHGILLAEGVPAESYLDTGHRHHFDGSDAVSLHPCFARGEHPDACARLATDAATVRPIWQRLADRAGVVWMPATTREPGLTLLLPDGVAMAPQQVDSAGRHSFWFPAEATAASVTARLRSRSQSPAGLRPWCDDRRHLGVAVAAMLVWTVEGGLDPVALPFDRGTARCGWWPSDRGDPAAWTDGDAALPLPAGCLRLDVILAATAEYAAA